MFTERKIHQFAAKVSDLPDTPSLSAQELKARFDACPEQLRQALNGVCDDGKALEERIDAYRAQTFTGEVTRDMLAQEVQEELSSKAEQSALASEIKARETLTQAVAQKCEAIIASYEGNGAESQFINLGFTPKAVLVFDGTGKSFARESLGGAGYSGGLVLPGHPLKTAETGQEHTVLEIASGGFRVFYRQYSPGRDNYYVQTNSGTHYYIAFK